jgi:hypothetical protein
VADLARELCYENPMVEAMQRPGSQDVYISIIAAIFLNIWKEIQEDVPERACNFQRV